MTRNTLISALILAAGLAAAGGLAGAKKAANTDNDPAADLAKATISLIEAIGTAESHAGGKAAKAELEGGRDRLVFEIEIVTAEGKIFDVEVDPVSGKVLSSKTGTADRDDDEDDD